MTWTLLANAAEWAAWCAAESPDVAQPVPASWPVLASMPHVVPYTAVVVEVGDAAQLLHAKLGHGHFELQRVDFGEGQAKLAQAESPSVPIVDASTVAAIADPKLYEYVVANTPVLREVMEQRIEDVQHPPEEAGLHVPKLRFVGTDGEMTHVPNLAERLARRAHASVNEPWIQLASGGRYAYGDSVAFDGMEPIRDVARPISTTPRYLAQTMEIPWAIAAHSTCVYLFATQLQWSPRARWWCLHHDDHEALVGDVPAPLKAYLRALGAYQPIQDLHDQAKRAVAHAWRQARLPGPTAEEAALVKRADLALLWGERQLLMAGGDRPWTTDAGVSDEDKSLAESLVNLMIDAGNVFGAAALGPYLNACRVADHAVDSSGGWA